MSFSIGRMFRGAIGAGFLATAALLTGVTASFAQSDFKGTIPLPDAKVGILAGTLGAEVVIDWEATARRGIEALGWKSQTIDGQNDPKIWGQAVSTFTQSGVDAIVIIGGLQLETFAAQLRAAKEAGIPIVHIGIRSADPQGFFDGDFAPDDAQFGVVLAEYLKKKLPPGDSFATLQLTSCELCNAPVPAAAGVLRAAGYKEAGTADIALNADLAGQAQKMSVDLIRAHPEVKTLISCCDFVATFAAPALAQAGFTDVVVTVRYDDLSVLNLIRRGMPVVTVAVNNNDFILTGIDALAANIASKKPIPASAPENLAQYAVVDSNNLPPEGEFYFSPDEALERFKAKWHQTYARN